MVDYMAEKVVLALVAWAMLLALSVLWSRGAPGRRKIYATAVTAGLVAYLVVAAVLYPLAPDNLGLAMAVVADICVSILVYVGLRDSRRGRIRR